MRRRLALSKDTLTELRSDELSAIAGANTPTDDCLPALSGYLLCPTVVGPCVFTHRCTR